MKSNIILLKLSDSFKSVYTDTETGRKLEVYPRYFSLPETDTRMVEEDGKVIAKQYIHGFKTVIDSKGVENINREPITFINGYFSFDANIFPYTYEYVITHSGCKNSKFAKYNLSTNKTPIFEIIDINKDKEAKLEKENFEANVMFRFADGHPQSYTETEILTYATIKGIDMNQSFKAIKYDVKTHAKLNPEKFAQEIKDASNEYKLSIKKADAYGIIAYSDNAWKWADTGRIICKVGTGKDRFTVLEDHCLLEVIGSTDLKDIMHRVDYFEKNDLHQKKLSVEKMESRLDTISMQNVASDSYVEDYKNNIAAEENFKPRGKAALKYGK